MKKIHLNMCTSSFDSVEELLAYLKKAHEGAIFQIFAPEVPEEKILFAFASALRSFEEKTNDSNDLSKEVLLRLAQTHNFSTALKLFGAKTPKEFLLLSSIPIKNSKNLKIIRKSI